MARLDRGGPSGYGFSSPAGPKPVASSYALVLNVETDVEDLPFTGLKVHEIVSVIALPSCPFRNRFPLALNFIVKFWLVFLLSEVSRPDPGDTSPMSPALIVHEFVPACGKSTVTIDSPTLASSPSVKPARSSTTFLVTPTIDFG